MLSNPDRTRAVWFIRGHDDPIRLSESIDGGMAHACHDWVAIRNLFATAFDDRRAEAP
jgi:hypothetical protein